MSWGRVCFIVYYLCSWQYEQYESRAVCPQETCYESRYIPPFAKSPLKPSCQPNHSPKCINPVFNGPYKPQQQDYTKITWPLYSLPTRTNIFVYFTWPAQPTINYGIASGETVFPNPSSVSYHVNPVVMVTVDENGSVETDVQTCVDFSYDDANVPSKVVIDKDKGVYDKKQVEKVIPVTEPDVDKCSEGEKPYLKAPKEKPEAEAPAKEISDASRMSPKNLGPVLFPPPPRDDDTESIDDDLNDMCESTN
ncbi:uncharacterized protein LOC113233109 [Hyposmocoma kahamanoa]|uniref:uncharacterized protein LOC113233109 n=1 Tax=Hyposmocoma kahamanoa TaxID=1477025 RepID=UPI000E6D8970|nr:uncharacterized protein LOC113233109 [Hyposmocoma kahamanoa]